MKYGLIGETLEHSFSPAIHKVLGSEPYELHPLRAEEVGSFLFAHDFKGINVTIPYKQAVIPYLTEIDPRAARIGAVNTIVTRQDGTLAGYNTDYAGMKYALTKAGIRISGKKALILGSGGTSHTARAVLSDLGAADIVIVSRRPAAASAAAEAPVQNTDIRQGAQVSAAENDVRQGAKASAAENDVRQGAEVSAAENDVRQRADASGADINVLQETIPSDPYLTTDYEHIYTDHADAGIIINTTPVGMYPNNGKSPVDLARFKDLAGVMDVIYNPLKTAFLMQAEELGIPSTGGLPMLVMQAKAAAELFLDKKIPDSVSDDICRSLKDSLTNIILIGMPGSGKTTIGKMLAETLGREFCDLDESIADTAGHSIPEIFEKFGEDYFRDLETAVARKECALCSRIIATGGGIVLREDNYAALAQNGYIVCLERDLAKLPLDGRPLSKSPEALVAMEKRRAPYYERFADASIDNNGTHEDTIDHILAMFGRR